MSNQLKTYQNWYQTNRGVRNDIKFMHQNTYNQYNRLPDKIINTNTYFWDNGFSKRYGRYAKITDAGPLDVPLTEKPKLNCPLRMTDFLYDDVSKKDLRLIRDRFKKGPINLKGYVSVKKHYNHSSHRWTYVIITWVLDDHYVIGNVHDFIDALKQKLI